MDYSISEQANSNWALNKALSQAKLQALLVFWILKVNERCISSFLARISKELSHNSENEKSCPPMKPWGTPLDQNQGFDDSWCFFTFTTKSDQDLGYLIFLYKKMFLVLDNFFIGRILTQSWYSFLIFQKNSLYIWMQQRTMDVWFLGGGPWGTKTTPSSQ